MSESSWTSPELIAVAAGDSHEPAVAAANGVVHVVWSSDRLIYHARLVDGVWQAPVRFTSGEQPALVAGKDGALHCVFSNSFLGNSEIYYIRYTGQKWGFPEWVSRTPGGSVQPGIALDASGAPHVVWSDDTAGRPAIYYAARGRVAWLYSQIPDCPGTNPTVAMAAGGEAFVAWQDRINVADGKKIVAGPHQVLCTVLADAAWSIPLFVSADRSVEAIGPRLAAGEAGDVHAVWQEEQRGHFHIRYSRYLGSSWSQSTDLSEGAFNAGPVQVCLAANGCHVVWAEGGAIMHRSLGKDAGAQWSESETLAQEAPGVSELSVAVDADGTLSVVWSAFEGGENRRLHYAVRKAPAANFKTYLPGVTAVA